MSLYAAAEETSGSGGALTVVPGSGRPAKKPEHSKPRRVRRALREQFDAWLEMMPTQAWEVQVSPPADDDVRKSLKRKVVREAQIRRMTVDCEWRQDPDGTWWLRWWRVDEEA